MTVYLVTTGCYSDYGIEAAFSTRELAVEYMARRTGEEEYSVDFNDIEEWELDLPREQQRGAYGCHVNEDGTVGCEFYSVFNTPSMKPVRSRGGRGGSTRTFIGYGLTVEHARRAAEEYRAAVLMLES